MASTMSEWSREVKVGLLVYGHRGRRAPGGDRCRDIEVLVPIGLGQSTKVAKAVARLSARGTTPLCAALKQASGHLRSETTPGSLVLISDGSEECEHFVDQS